MFAWKIGPDSCINICFGMTAAQKTQNLVEFVFVLCPEYPCDWGGLPGFGVTAAPYAVHRKNHMLGGEASLMHRTSPLGTENGA